MRWIRKTHLYLSVFFAPLFLFYILTGAYQVLNLDRTKILGEEEGVLAKLRSVHVQMVYPVKTDQPGEYSVLPFKTMVVAMAICLLVSAGLGIFLAFQTTRKKWVVWLCLGLGAGIPVLTLWLSQPR